MSKTRTVYAGNLPLLQSLMIRDFATLEKEYTADDLINKDVKIQYTCNCGEIGCLKSFIAININNGAVCTKCSIKMSRVKAKKTYKERTGYETPLGNKELREKATRDYKEKTGYTNPTQNPEVKEKAKQTNIAKYGVENPFQSKDIMDKVRKEYKEKTGYANPNQNPEVKEKTKITNIAKYGVENVFQSENIMNKAWDKYKEKTGYNYPAQNPEVKEKSSETKFKNTGYYHNFSDPENRKKALETYERNTGYKHSSHNPEVLEKIAKSSFQFKDYTFPSGNIVKIQGYEHYCLNELLQTYKEDELRVNKTIIPSVSYIDKDNNERIHFADIYIPHINTLIEVKSSFTFEVNKENNLLKQKYAKGLGYIYVIKIYNEKGICIQSIE